MLTYDPDDTYWDCVCLLLPDGKATLVDTDVFERYGDSSWRLMGKDTIFRLVRYTVVVNPTAWRRNRKERIRYRFESLPRLVMNAPRNRQVDHVSRYRWDNRRRNLRVATASQNQMNKGKSRNKSSRYKGVHRLKVAVHGNRLVGDIGNRRSQ